MRPVHFALTLLLFFILPGLGHSAGYSAQPVLPECRSVWKNKSVNYQYDFNNEELRTPLGNEGYSSWPQRTKRSKCKKDWTFLVFMSTGDDLTPYALADLYEMEAGFVSGVYAGSTLKTDVLVEVDSLVERGSSRRLHMFQSPQRYDRNLKHEDLLQWSLSAVRSPIAGMVNARQTAETRLYSFLSWAIERYPAKNYAVVIWGHGQGWRTERFDPLPLSLSVPVVQQVLSRVRYERLGGEPFAIYISDACLMQQLEVAYELADETRFVVGSAQMQSYYGLPYRRLFYELNRGSFLGYRSKTYGRGYHGKLGEEVDEAYLLARMLPELYQSSMNQRGFKGLQAEFDVDADEYLTMSSLSSWELKNHFKPKFVEFVRLLSEFIVLEPEFLWNFRAAMGDAPSFAYGYKDFGLFLQTLKIAIYQYQLFSGLLPGEVLSEDELAAFASYQLVWQTDALEDALRRAVIGQVMGKDYWFGDRYIVAQGVSQWIPSSAEDFVRRRDDFSKSKFYRDIGSGWLELLSLAYP